MPLLRFDAFMNHALYHSEHGYYSKNIRSVGARGDFSTTATLSTDLATVIAKWIKSEVNKLSVKKIDIIEVGAGTGVLMHDVYNNLPFTVRRKCRFNIVETSQPLQQRQRETLSKIPIQWHNNMMDALIVAKGVAIIYSNELVDAFPVRVFQTLQDQSFAELYIDTEKRTEVFQPLSVKNQPASSFFECSLPRNIRFEVHESYQQWLTEWSHYWKAGSLLTIDYGDTDHNIIKHFPKGTLRGYLMQNRISGSALYQSVGHQDLTADVNFTDLTKWSNQLNLKSLPLLNLGEFTSHYLPENKSPNFINSNAGVSSAFKVLINFPD